MRLGALLGHFCVGTLGTTAPGSGGFLLNLVIISSIVLVNASLDLVKVSSMDLAKFSSTEILITACIHGSFGLVWEG